MKSKGILTQNQGINENVRACDISKKLTYTIQEITEFLHFKKISIYIVVFDVVA